MKLELGLLMLINMLMGFYYGLLLIDCGKVQRINEEFKKLDVMGFGEILTKYIL